MSERHVNRDEEQPSTTTRVDALPGAAATTASFERPISETNPPDVSMDDAPQANFVFLLLNSIVLFITLRPAERRTRVKRVPESTRYSVVSI